MIFSGFNQRAVIAFCRECKRLEVPFCIVAKSFEDPILLTIYKENVFAVRKEKALMVEDVDDCFVQVKSKVDFQEFVVLPSSEFLNRFFLQNRMYYQRQDITIPLVSEQLYARISNKYSFGELCKKHNLEIPREIPISALPEYPFVAKPKSYFSGESLKTPPPYLIYTKKDWQEFLSTENSDDFYFQEFLTGKSIYLLYFISLNNKSVYFSQENLMQQSKGKSIILARCAKVHEEKIADEYAVMLKKEGFEGLIMIELKDLDGRYCMIEANPRLWGPSQLFVDAGVPIFEEFIRDQGFNFTTDSSEIKECMYFWHGGIVEDEKNGHTIAYHNYTQELFFSRKDLLLENEIYLRKDTKNIYYQELKKIC